MTINCFIDGRLVVVVAHKGCWPSMQEDRGVTEHVAVQEVNKPI
jgi:hypothetical protein